MNNEQPILIIGAGDAAGATAARLAALQHVHDQPIQIVTAEQALKMAQFEPTNPIAQTFIYKASPMVTEMQKSQPLPNRRARRKAERDAKKKRNK